MLGAEKSAEMKVHPAILMKTIKADFGCQGLSTGLGIRDSKHCARKSAEMKVHPAMLMKTKKGRYAALGRDTGHNLRGRGDNCRGNYEKADQSICPDDLGKRV